MKDRELLEKAAKAAGYKVRWHENWQCFVHVGPFNTNNPPTLAGQRMVWVPLDDDGDAFRLMIRMVRIVIETGKTWPIDESYPRGEPSDDCAKARRAIVSAAAMSECAE